MNSIFYKIHPPTERGTIDTICDLLAQRNFNEAEHQLLNHLNELMSREYNTDDDTQAALSTIQTYYIRFNEYYSNWAQNNGRDKQKEINELTNDIHENVLFANMSDPESMDDMVYAIASFISNMEDEDEMEEAYNHLSCYSKYIS